MGRAEQSRVGRGRKGRQGICSLLPSAVCYPPILPASISIILLDLPGTSGIPVAHPSCVQVWDFARVATEAVLAGHGGDVKCVDWHPHKALLVSGGCWMLGSGCWCCPSPGYAAGVRRALLACCLQSLLVPGGCSITPLLAGVPQFPDR